MGGSPKINDKIRNIFMFAGNKDANEKKNKNSNHSLFNRTPRRNLTTKKKVKQPVEPESYHHIGHQDHPNEKFTKNCFLENYHHTKQATEMTDQKNYHSQFSNHIKPSSIKKKEKTFENFCSAIVADKNENLNFAEQVEQLKKNLLSFRSNAIGQAQEEQNFINSLDRFASDLNQSKVTNPLAKSNYSSSQRNYSNLFKVTKDKLSTIFKSIGGVLSEFDQKKKSKQKSDEETEIEHKKLKEVAFSN